MARCKKTSKKPATSATVTEFTLILEADEGKRSEFDEGLPDEVDEFFKDSMVDFPEVGNREPLEEDEGSSGGKRNGWIWNDLAAGETEFQSQAKDKWAQFRSLLPNQGGAKLKFEEPLIREGQRIAQVDLEEIQVETSFWNSAMICMVLGANPPFVVFEGFIKRIWGKLGIDRIVRLNAGFTLVKFRDEATRDLVLEAGVLHFDRKLVIVKPWSADLDTVKVVKSVPVWIRLPGLGLQYWGTKCLSALMSTIGNPILVDNVKKNRTMMQFSRVLVEIEITEEVPKSIQFINEKGQLMEQLLDFEWIPTQCKSCRVYGHTEKMCNRKQSETWRSKVRNDEDKTKQDPKEKQSVIGVKDVPNEGSDVGQEKIATMEGSESQDLSKHHGTLADSEKKCDKNVNDSSERSPSEWTIPKRVGGNKKRVLHSQNKLKNSYSALQDKVMEVTNLGTTSEGRILLIWQRQSISVEVLKESDQLVHVLIKEMRSNKQSCVTFLYGRNSIEERRQMWEDLSVLCFPATPWLVAGDFNVVFEYTDRVGGRSITAMELMDAQTWRELGLVDEMRSRGSHFTWTYKQANEDRIYSKLEKNFINEAWLDLYPHDEAVVNWELFSDHCLCVIKSGAVVNCGVKPFQFFNMWTDHEKFTELVLQSWCKPCKGYGLERIVRKLGRLEQVLRKFNKSDAGDVVQNYNTAKENYQNAQLSLQTDPHSSVMQREERVAGELFATHARIYDSFMRQRSKINWLCYATQACLKQRRASNRITSYVNESGQLIERFEEVVDHFVNHFRKVMGSQSTASVLIQTSCFRLGHRLALDQQLGLIKPFTRKEVEDALFSISSIKSPDPDWYGSGFFKAMWKDLGSDFTEAVLEFFDRGVLPEEMNKATITLIPKIDTPSKEVSNSVQIIKDSFTKFSMASGLTANLDKSQVREKMEDWLGRDIWSCRYEDWSAWMVGKPKDLKQKVAVAAMAAAVYMVWKNRNNCIFAFSSLSVDFVVKLIKYYLKFRLTRFPKLKVKKKDVAFFENFVQL
ncbi:uncharacterized protein LOC133814434 [Humulus lupulus]|uniref:uncharacterized protein LOC133814434 n=1 Tax=Humulus lupulus TaxID=3486 RepID=UPI002B403D4D|nr:uncharacterized protein LOC133814434 [Humulus lupulus]